MQKIIKICMEDVKNHFTDKKQGIEFGAYIQPENYFVSYIFATDAQLKAAQQSGLGPFLGFLPCSPHYKPEVYEDGVLDGDYDFYRPIIRTELE